MSAARNHALLQYAERLIGMAFEMAMDAGEVELAKEIATVRRRARSRCSLAFAKSLDVAETEPD